MWLIIPLLMCFYVITTSLPIKFLAEEKEVGGLFCWHTTTILCNTELLNNVVVAKSNVAVCKSNLLNSELLLPLYAHHGDHNQVLMNFLNKFYTSLCSVI